MPIAADREAPTGAPGRAKPGRGRYNAGGAAWRHCLVAGVASVLLVIGFARAEARSGDAALPALNADLRQTSVSGISSGAFMAVQFGVAWSSIVTGVGAIAGGPYFCAQGSTATALSDCMLDAPEGPDLPTLIRDTDRWVASDAIDATAGIAAQRIYLFSGYNDDVVLRPIVDALARYYAHYLGPDHRGALFEQTAIGAGHAQVTADYGAACTFNGGHYINDCNYDQAGILLQHIYGALHPPGAAPLTGHLLAFAQAAFAPGRDPAAVGLDATGYAYIPAACAAMQACRVHIALHGCLQGVATIGRDYVLHAGYNEWADSNGIVVLYPQARATVMPFNPQGCWDWFGYTDASPLDPRYATKAAPQIAAIKAMLDRLTAGYQPPAPPASETALAAPAVLVNDRSDTAIDLAWTPVPGAAEYEVERGAASGAAPQSVATVPGPSFADAGLVPNASYVYRVRPLAGGVSGPFSAPLMATTLARPPRCDDPGSCPLSP